MTGTKKTSKNKSEKVPPQNEEKKHPWRVCPLGMHLVREHPVRYKPSKLHPNGKISITRQHCAKNPSRKDVLSFSEIQSITENTFTKLKNKNNLGTLVDFKEKGNKYDHLITGWVTYWNEVLKLDDPLDPTLVKALKPKRGAKRLYIQNHLRENN